MQERCNLTSRLSTSTRKSPNEQVRCRGSRLASCQIGHRWAAKGGQVAACWGQGHIKCFHLEATEFLLISFRIDSHHQDFGGSRVDEDRAIRTVELAPVRSLGCERVVRGTGTSMAVSHTTQSLLLFN